MKRVRLGLTFLLLFLFLFNFSAFAKSSINNKTSYQLNFKSKILKIGESFNLKVISKSQSVNNLKVAFSSSNNRVASVDKNGRVRAIGVGYAEIRAEIKDKNIRLACIIQVKPNEVEKISLNVRKLNLKVGETYELSAKVYPNNATNKDLIWINSNPEIVEVYNGKVFAKN
ncbi:Ig-like domain-containing protein [Caloramator sp. Dgby_cultured_2]|uniref:Ig-like domain-containing protein n=1 Tax=Caloramator sp. Dgby_cultured_2 TaxID=3029174 RepID=UPI00237D9836|nr:Ig-like domain-containing protein [Caloramator sp. Dgby_cultured_2]WDU84351.1 Ig-like domain-containing protein [Caloramator sp. Dgby_cultured_2]